MDKKKVVKVIGNAEHALENLETGIASFITKGKSPPKSDAQLLKSINRALDGLTMNPFLGNSVPHRLWPREFKNLPNLFRLELSQSWRLLYYVTGNDVIIVSVVFEICDHQTYDGIFGYKKR
jgi:Txe/YoeB family toxin of Txe-Axe toxin-antitoxin module